MNFKDEMLLLCGSLCKEVKEKIRTRSFRTDVEIGAYVENLCRIHGLDQSFPTMVMVNNQVANHTPNKDKPIGLDDKEIYTVDFGFTKEGCYPTDNSVVVCSNERIELYVQEYGAIISRVTEALNEQYLRNGYLTIGSISNQVQREFDKSSFSFFIIPYCDAHTIEPDQLHAKTIPMTYESAKDSDLEEKLQKGTVFTIEPHVLIPERIVCPRFQDPSTEAYYYRIKENNSKMSTLKVWDCRSQVIGVMVSKEPLLVRYYLKNSIPEKHKDKGMFIVDKTLSNRLAFFQEDTFRLDRELIKIT